MLRKIVKKLLVRIEDETVSRADLFVDFITDEKLEEIESISWITRAKKLAVYKYCDSFTGLSIGLGGVISARIYDKTLEIGVSHKYYLKEIWEKRGWDTVQKVWRLEFQLKRVCLKEMSINTFANLMEKVNSLWLYCSSDWLRLAVKDDTANRTRWMPNPMWKEIQGVRINDGKLRWYIDFYVDGIRKREGVGYSKTLAKKALAKRTTEVSEERYINKPKGGILFKEFAEQWLEERKAHLKRSSYYDYKGIFDLYLISAFGKKRLGKVTEADIENLIKDLKGNLSNKRVNNILVPLKTMYKTAYRRKIVTINPIDGIGMLRVEKTEIRPLSMEEVRLFLENVDSHFRDYFEVAFFTGMRPSEQIALKWDNIDFNRAKINVIDARVMGEESAPKTVASRRSIDMLPPVKEALERQSGKTFTDSPYVFVSKEGNIVDIGNLRKRTWYPTLESAELNPTFAIRH